MTLQEVSKIIIDEELDNYCLFCDNKAKENEVVISKDFNGWRVFTNDERATPVSEIKYDNECDALRDFIERLRGDKAFRKYFG